MRKPTRRSVLGATTALISALAGCGQQSDGGEATDDAGSNTDTTPTPETTDDQTTDQQMTDDQTTDEQTTDQQTTDEQTTDQQTTDQQTTDDQTTDELDLREANVVEVAIEHTGGEDYRFDVTLFHDDDGEEGYADWWQVETLDGERLGRRDLMHAHSTEPFTRSETMSVPEDCVVVRGHDQTHGYGGQAMLVTIPDGTTRSVRQGDEPTQFDAEECP